jgi:exonuclease VII large subunit
MPAAPGDRAFNTATSAEAQANFKAAATELEALLTSRQQQVDAAMQHYEATGVSEEYHAKEQRWNTIISTLRQSLEQNDETAQGAIRRAGNAVANIV